MGVTKVCSANSWTEPLFKITVGVRSIQFRQALQTVQPCSVNLVIERHHYHMSFMALLTLGFSTTQLLPDALVCANSDRNAGFEGAT